MNNRFDIIYLHELKVDATIGITHWEQQIKQTIILDLEMAVDTRQAAASQNIADTVDYYQVAKRIISFISEQQFTLIESLAEQLAKLILQEFKVPWLRLKINKPGMVTKAKHVGLIIERGSFE